MVQEVSRWPCYNDRDDFRRADFQSALVAGRIENPPYGTEGTGPGTRHRFGSGTANAVFPREAVKITGERKSYTSIADSGSVMHRSFCPDCGTGVFSEAEPRPNLIIVRVGTWDDPEIGKPTASIWASSAPSWAFIDATLPQFDGPAPAK